MPDHDVPPGLLTSSGLGLLSSDSLVQKAPARPGVALAPAEIAAESDVRTHSPGAAHPAPAQPHNPEEPPGWTEGLGALPLGYGDDRLVCLARDPSTAFVYWDLSQRLVAQAFDGLTGARALLKLIHSSGELLRELEIDLAWRSFYLRELPPGAHFRVELWASGVGGARLLRSARPVFLPPSEASDLLDEQYLRLGFDAPLSGATLAAAARPQHWRAAANFPGWSRLVPSAGDAAGTRSSISEDRLRSLDLASGSGKPSGVKP